ncbi:MAG: hypothetical protein M3Y34_00680 [Actinomycetota bacterium]|nr:hypothetical protein [Actinomycetota bacterium]
MASAQTSGDWERDERTVAWVYGGMLTGAAVVVASSKIATEPWQVTLYTLVATIVLWLAHAYAAFVGHGGRFEGGEVRARLRHAFAVESAVLAAGMPTVAATAVAAISGASVSEAGFVGAGAAMATMVVAAGLAARRSGARPLGVAVGALGAGLIGGLLIAAKVALK